MIKILSINTAKLLVNNIRQIILRRIHSATLLVMKRFLLPKKV